MCMSGYQNQANSDVPCCAAVMQLQGKRRARGLVLMGRFVAQVTPGCFHSIVSSSRRMQPAVPAVWSTGGLCVPGVDQCREGCISEALRPRQTGGEE